MNRFVVGGQSPIRQFTAMINCFTPNRLVTPTRSSTIINIFNNSIRYMATKKAGGSSTNGRDSIGRRLGIKVWPNKQTSVMPGNILVRQRGQKFRAGIHVGMGKDHTLYAKVAGIVYMTKLSTNKKRNIVHIEPHGETNIHGIITIPNKTKIIE